MKSDLVTILRRRASDILWLNQEDDVTSGTAQKEFNGISTEDQLNYGAYLQVSR